MQEVLSDPITATLSIDERSKIYLRHVIVLFKSFNVRELGWAYEKYIKSALVEAETSGNFFAESRLLYSL